MITEEKRQAMQILLDETDSYLSVEGLHALLSGYISGGGNPRPEIWTEILLDESSQDPAVNEIYTSIEASLEDLEMSFTIPLPSDEESIKSRAEALVSWCKEFITGLGLSGCSQKELNKDEISEALQDLTEITQLDTDSIGDSETEQDEKDLFELIEYSRSMVLYIYTSLQYNKQVKN